MSEQVGYWVNLRPGGFTFETESHTVERVARKLGATTDWMLVGDS